MYCPQCGTESSEGLQYCRSCGANLKVIGKAVSLSEAIARSDRGPLPKIKEMMKNLKIEHVSEDISKALDQMNKEIARSSDDPKSRKPKWMPRTEAEDCRAAAREAFHQRRRFLFQWHRLRDLSLLPDQCVSPEVAAGCNSQNSV